MGKDKKDKFILALAIVVVLLLGFLGYLFLVQPALSGLVVKGYNQAQVDVITAILSQVETNGYVQIPAGENQSVVLVPYQQQTQPAN
jgi:hypothetical protein